MRITQYELNIIRTDNHDITMESGIEALIRTMRNKYGIKTSKNYVLNSIKLTGIYRALSSDSKNLIELKKLPKRKIQERKYLKSMTDKTSKLLDKYRKAYDKCLLNNDKDTGAIVEYYCRKLTKSYRFWFESYIGSLS